MKLNVQDRIIIPSLLSKENTFINFSLKRAIMDKVALKDEDIENYSITVDNETKAIKWDIQKDAENPLEVEFNPSEADYLKKSCEKLADTLQTDQFWMTVKKLYEEL